MIAGSRDDLCYTPAVELRRMLQDRSVSARELMASLLERIEEVNSSLNAIVALRAEGALEDAARFDARRDDQTGLIAGVPFTAKDLNETLELPTTHGSRAFREHQAGFEAVVVARLKQAGGILVGKTNTPEFGLRATTENLLFGTSRNPWNLEHNPGGSSGGAGAAIAAGISPLSLGGDGGGSIRNPGSCNAVVGLKPTRGRVPSAPAAYELWSGLATHGPLARTVRDTALMLDVMSGPVVGEPYGMPRPEESFLSACDRRVPRLRLAYTVTPGHGSVDPEVKEAVHRAAQVFEELGHEVQDAGPDLGGLREAFITIVAAQAAALMPSIPEPRLADLESSTLALMVRGQALTAADYCAAVDLVRKGSARIMQFWERYDVLLTPTMTQLPPRVGALPSSDDLETRWRETTDLGAFTYPFNMSGQPGLSVPAEWSREGLPIGVQLVGRYGAEADLLAMAARYEEASPWADRRPQLVRQPAS